MKKENKTSASDQERRTIETYIPAAALENIRTLIAHERLQIKIKRERKTRHGDYRLLPDGRHQISINANLNPYKFLITLVHEIAHLKAFKEYGRAIKPHGKEWKQTFKRLMLPFIHPNIFPEDLLGPIAQHFKNPRASTDTDTTLALALKQYSADNGKQMVEQLQPGQRFRLYNGRVFKRGIKRRKRVECMEQSTGRIYLFNPLAEVDLIE